MPKKITTETFISRAQQIHGLRYDYSYVVYTKMHEKVKIIDPEFGEFWQTPMGHLQGQGHPEHGKLKAANKRRTPLDAFIYEANKIHGNLYDYSKVQYTHCDEKICIIDPEFGEFWQTPYQHLRSHGCPARTKQKKWIIHEDHIIPLSIIRSNKRRFTAWDKDRPLYKFLNSPANLRKISAKQNREKSDIITVNNKVVSASSVRNNYEIISILIETLIKVDPTKVIEDDKQFIRNYFGL